MKNLVWALVVLAIIAVLVAIWSPWLWQALITAVFLFFVAAGIHGTTTNKE